MKNLVVYEVYTEQHPDHSVDSAPSINYETIAVRYKSCLTGAVTLSVLYIDAATIDFTKWDIDTVIASYLKDEISYAFKVPEEEIVLLRVGKL